MPTPSGESLRVPAAEALALAMVEGRRLLDPRLAPSGRHVALVTAGGGRRALSVVAVDDGGEDGPGWLELVGPRPAACHPRGGGLLCWLPDSSGLVVCSEADGLVCLSLDGQPWVGLQRTAGAWSPAVSPEGTRVVYVDDERWVAVAWLGEPGEVPWPVRVGGYPGRAGSADGTFAIDPVWSPDGTLLAWTTWDATTMPFLGAKVVVARAPAADPSGAALPGPGDVVMVLEDPDATFLQPRFSPDGERLGFLTDVFGWLELAVTGVGGGAGGAPEAVSPGRREEDGTPCWGPGQRSWTWLDGGERAAVASVSDGFGRLQVLDLTGRQPPLELGRGVHWALDCSAGTLSALRSGARTPDQLVTYRPDQPVRGDGGRSRRVLIQGPPALDRSVLVEPEPVSFPAPHLEGLAWPDDGPVHGRLYWPPGVPRSSALPMVLWVHGGPTDQLRVEFNARIARLGARGWAVLVVDHRGSTGWGRAYARALRGRWGLLDAADLAEAARSALRRGWCRPGCLVAMGGSAGGFSVLHLLSDSDVPVAAGIALYPPSDLVDLAAHTHRLERHYDDWLVGPPEESGRLARRSPLSRSAEMRRPLLVLHGSEDPVVPPAQSERLVDAIRRAGGDAELVVLEGEGHGWSSAASVERELAVVDAFLGRVVTRAGWGEPTSGGEGEARRGA